jgi:hypothetical protein
MATEEEAKEQEREFGLWGINKELRRGFIVFFISILIVVIGYMKVDIDRHDERHRIEVERLQKQVIDCVTETAKTINEMRVEQIKIINEQAARDREARERLEKLAKKIRR